ANEEFTAFLLKEPGQRELPSESGKLLCALATAGRNLSTLAKTRVGKAWLEAVLAMDEAGHGKVCTPEDLELAVARLRQMPGKDAQQLIFSVARLCTEHVVMAGLVREGATLPDDPSQVLSSLRKRLLSEWTADEMVEGFATHADNTGHLEEEVAGVAVEAGSLEESDQVEIPQQRASQNEDESLEV
ncbi:GIP, partial [Symbiodinium microadriaticum]